MNKPKLVDAGGRPLNGKTELIIPGKRKLTPEEQVSRMIRQLETARRGELKKLCGVIHAYAMRGWRFVVDEKVQTCKAEVMLISHLRRDVNGHLENINEQVCRMGMEFLPALQYLAELDAKIRESVMKDDVEAAQKEADSEEPEQNTEAPGDKPAAGQADA